LALMSKAMFVTLPLVLLLLDFWPLERGKKEGSGTKWWWPVRLHGDRFSKKETVETVGTPGRASLTQLKLGVNERRPDRGIYPGSHFVLLEKVPFFAMALVAGLITIRAQKELGAVQSVGHLPVIDRIANAILSAVQ